MVITLAQSKAVLFDLDGVLVPTVGLHKQAWKQLFDQILPSHVQPYSEQDYYAYVDGKPRYDGVAALLESRGMNVAWGAPSDSQDSETICGFGNRKNALFEQLLDEQGIEPYQDTVDVLQHLLGLGKRLAVVSSSRNTQTVLRLAGIDHFFSEVVDGNTRAQHGLQGKPAPDTYAFAAQQLGLSNAECLIVEDALSGVAAGRAGSFGLVVGLDRGAGREALAAAGAELVVNQLVELIEGSAHRHIIESRHLLHQEQYPVNAWSFEQVGHLTSESATLFSVSNGNIGIRASGDPTRALGSGTFMSGFHDTYAIKHAEGAYGYARVGQMIQGVPDACGFSLQVDGKPLPTPQQNYQCIDFKTGISKVQHQVRMEDGAELSIEVERMACLFDPNLAVCTLRVESPDRDCELTVNGHINADIPSGVSSDDPRKSQPVDGCGIHEVAIEGQLTTDNSEVHLYETNNSALSVAMAVRQEIQQDCIREALLGDNWQLSVKRGESLVIERFIAYHAFPLRPDGAGENLSVHTCGGDADELVSRCLETLQKASSSGVIGLREQQRIWLDDFWQRGDIEVEAGDDGRIQQIVRWELFQLAQATAQVTNGVGAKGLSGSGYDGHYFWDTEIYLLPFLIYTDPICAQKLLHYRYLMLPAARKRAAEMNLEGALYPWRTINGEEASAYFPTGTAQYHIDADVAYGLVQYVLVSGDVAFLAEEGIDILVQTARMWLSLGSYQDDGQFHIACVTGPDEYTALVDDDFYTNQMARFNLQSACFAARSLEERDSEAYRHIQERLALSSEEIDHWSQAAEAMYTATGGHPLVHAQDSQFMARPRWDFEHLTARPLLLHYHPLKIYSHQVLKQTDVVLSLMLLSSWFTLEQKRADFDFYDPLTVGDSTLSAASQSVIAAEVGYEELAQRYFMESLFADVCNLHANTTDGIHLAAAGGVWSTLVCGFGGLRDTGGTDISINARLPQSWKSLTYRLTIGGTRIKVVVDETGTHLERLVGPELTVKVNGMNCIV